MAKLLLNEEKINIRWTDMDPYHHVAHQRYFDYLTETRHAELIKPYLENQQENFFLVDVNCNFNKALEYPETITIKQYLVAIGTTSFTFEFEFFNDKAELCATAFSTLVSVDAESHKKIPIPSYLQKKFSSAELPEKYLVDKLIINNDEKPLLTKIMPTRYADLDAFCHVNNTHYFDYMLEARHVLFPDNNALNAPCYFFIINARCVFYQPVNYPGDVEVKLYLTHTGRSSFTFAYKILQHSELCAEGSTVLVCIDKEKLSPIKIPDEMIALIRSQP